MIAEAVQHMLAAGMPHDAIVAAIAAMEACKDTRSAGAKRQERYRRNKASQVTECDASDAVVSPEVSPNDIYSNPLPTPIPSPKATPSPRKREAIAIAKPDDVDDRLWTDWSRLRAKQGAPPTETVIAAIRREAAKLNWTLSQALVECCERSWRGFKADWVKKEQRNGTDRFQQRGETGGPGPTIRAAQQFLADLGVAPE